MYFTIEKDSHIDLFKIINEDRLFEVLDFVIMIDNSFEKQLQFRYTTMKIYNANGKESEF